MNDFDDDTKEAVYEAAKLLRRWAGCELAMDIKVFGDVTDDAVIDLMAALEELFPDIIDDLNAEDEEENARRRH